jgi:hypothetical protein
MEMVYKLPGEPVAAASVIVTLTAKRGQNGSNRSDPYEAGDPAL